MYLVTLQSGVWLPSHAVHGISYILVRWKGKAKSQGRIYEEELMDMRYTLSMPSGMRKIIENWIKSSVRYSDEVTDYGRRRRPKRSDYNKKNRHEDSCRIIPGNNNSSSQKFRQNSFFFFFFFFLWFYKILICFSLWISTEFCWNI